MQQSNAPSKLVLPFANAGAKNTIPAASQIGITAGAASLVDGFPPLTRAPLSAGGVPPSGQDMNGILFTLSALARWFASGGSFPFDSTFAADTNVGGYPKSAIVQRTDGIGFWLNTVENNTTDPEAAGAAAAGWVPAETYGSTAVTMTNANVTLTPLQYGKPIIVLSGVLTANLNLVFPAIATQWVVINNCTGAFSVTCKTSGGTGVAVTQGKSSIVLCDGTNVLSAISDPAAAPARQIQPISAAVASNILTLTLNPTVLDFRATSGNNGTVTTRTVATPISVAVPANATLGCVNGVQARLAVIAIDNAGIVELGVCNIFSAGSFDESSAVTTVALGAGSTSGGVIYSASARATVPYRLVGFVDIVYTTGTGWAAAPVLVQGAGGASMASFGSLGHGQAWQGVSGSRTLGTTYYNTTGRPICVQASATSTTSANILGTVNGSTVAAMGATSGITMGVSFIVPPGSSYTVSVSAGTPTLGAWSELR